MAAIKLHSGSVRAELWKCRHICAHVSEDVCLCVGGELWGNNAAAWIPYSVPPNCSKYVGKYHQSGCAGGAQVIFYIKRWSNLSCFSMTAPCAKSQVHKEMFLMWKNLTDLQPDPTPVGEGETAWEKISVARQQGMNANGSRTKCVIKDGNKVKMIPVGKK